MYGLVMFETSVMAEILVPPLFEKDTKLWGYVHLNLHLQWFHAEYEITFDEGAFRKTIFLANVEQLLQLSEEPDCRIVQVDLVSPAYLNKTDSWKMEPMSEVWKGFDPCAEREVEIYILRDGTRYIESNSMEDSLQNKRLLFLINEKESGAPH